MSAIVFMECNAGANGSGPSNQDISSYMVEENFSGTWFGFLVNGIPNNPSEAIDMAIYMDWPGWINGTENNLIGPLTAGVPSESLKSTLLVDPAGQKPNTLNPDLVK